MTACGQETRRVYSAAGAGDNIFYISFFICHNLVEKGEILYFSASPDKNTTFEDHGWRTTVDVWSPFIHTAVHFYTKMNMCASESRCLTPFWLPVDVFASVFYSSLSQQTGNSYGSDFLISFCQT